MILCHKCSGILASACNENTSGLFGCGCISGWVRGFEPNRTREQAIETQFNECLSRVALYERQDRPKDWVDRQYERADKLLQLL